MADHSKPTITSTYANYTSEIDARFDDLAVGLDPAVTTATNVPTNSIRYSSASNKWQKWNGTTWGDLSSGYAINITGSAGSVDWANVQNKPPIAQADGNTYNLSVSGSAASLTTARTINGVSFNGTANINVNTVNTVTFNNSGLGDASGTTFNGGLARTISYNSIGAPSISGANATGTWAISITGSSASTSGNAATATALQTARTINGVSFNGTANIDVEPYIEQDNSTNANRYVTFVDSSTAGNQRLNLDTDLIYNPSTNTLSTNVSGSATNSITADKLSSSSGSAPSYACRAWVNFNGTDITIRASGNVSSITDNGIGDYTVNFTTAMPDENYSVHAFVRANASFGRGDTVTAAELPGAANGASTPTSSGFRFYCKYGTMITDTTHANIAVFR